MYWDLIGLWLLQYDNRNITFSSSLQACTLTHDASSVILVEHMHTSLVLVKIKLEL